MVRCASGGEGSFGRRCQPASLPCSIVAFVLCPVQIGGLGVLGGGVGCMCNNGVVWAKFRRSLSGVCVKVPRAVIQPVLCCGTQRHVQLLPVRCGFGRAHLGWKLFMPILPHLEFVEQQSTVLRCGNEGLQKRVGYCVAGETATRHHSANGPGCITDFYWGCQGLGKHSEPGNRNIFS